MHPQTSMTQLTPRLHMSQFRMSRLGASRGSAPKNALGDTVVWRTDGEEMEMSRVWGFLNWWVDLNEDGAKVSFWRLVKPEQTYFRNSANGKHTDPTPLWHPIFSVWTTVGTSCLDLTSRLVTVMNSGTLKQILPMAALSDYTLWTKILGHMAKSLNLGWAQLSTRL